MAKRITVQNMCTVLKAQQHHFKLNKYNNTHLTSEDTRIVNKYGDKNLSSKSQTISELQINQSKKLTRYTF